MPGTGADSCDSNSDFTFRLRARQSACAVDGTRTFLQTRDGLGQGCPAMGHKVIEHVKAASRMSRTMIQHSLKEMPTFAGKDFNSLSVYNSDNSVRRSGEQSSMPEKLSEAKGHALVPLCPCLIAPRW